MVSFCMNFIFMCVKRQSMNLVCLFCIYISYIPVFAVEVAAAQAEVSLFQTPQAGQGS